MDCELKVFIRLNSNKRLRCYGNAQESADKVCESSCQDADSEHAESAEQQTAAGEDGNQSAEDEEAGAAHSCAGNERCVSGKQKIRNDGNHSPASECDKRARRRDP